jgi:ferredoxin
MAQLSDRHPANIPGLWYNDTSCIDCGLCPEIAPSVFRRHDSDGQTIVWHQPGTAEELDLARQAREACPTESIGSDGIPSGGSGV